MSQVKPFMLKYVVRFFILIIILLGTAEIVLRYKYGFCNAPLYISDPDFEYIYAPNQDLTRFGNVIRTNNLSMRSDALSPKDSLVILLIGDSVINGGNLTDHDRIASTMLEKRFLKTYGKHVRVLNISAGSWGPDNMAGYLKKYGTFKAKLICLVTSSHDAHDIMAHESIVGLDPGMPDKQYKVALYELWDRYRLVLYYQFVWFFYPPGEVEQESEQKKETKAKSAEIASTVPDSARKDSVKQIKLNDAGIRKPGIGFNPGYEQLLSIAKADSIPFFIYLHPEVSEIEMGHFNDQGNEIIDFAKQNNIRLINELTLGVKSNYYRDLDVIHYNDKGQMFLADNLFPLFSSYLKKSL